MTVCIQCSLRAFVEGKPSPVFDERPEAHAARCHSDAEATEKERQELMKLAAEKLKNDKAEV